MGSWTGRSMIILCDVDGVLADFEGHIRAHAKLETPTTEMDFRLTHTKEELARVKVCADSEKFCYTMPSFQGSLRFVRRLERMGELYAVTAPWVSSKYWMHERFVWLAAGGFNSQRIIMCPSASKHLVRGDIMIEDTPRNLFTWLNANPTGHGLLYDLPWNREGTKTFDQVGPHPRMTRVLDYDEALDAIEEYDKMVLK